MSDIGCRIFTTRMSDFYNSDVGFLQLGCRIFTTSLLDFQQLRGHLQASLVMASNPTAFIYGKSYLLKV